MEEATKERARAGSTEQIEENNVFSSTANASLPLRMHDTPELSVSDTDDQDDTANHATSSEDAETLIGPSISHAQTHLKSARTPAAEKAAAMEEGGGYFIDSDPETPPIPHRRIDGQVYAGDYIEIRRGELTPGVRSSSPGEDHRLPNERESAKSNRPTSPKFVEGQIAPTAPYPPGAKSLTLRHAQTAQTSSLHGVFDSGRKRSVSNSADAIRKFLPSLPSMAQVGNLFGPSASHSGQRSKTGTSTPSSPRLASQSGSPPIASPPPARSMQMTIPPRQSSSGASRPKALRRVTSDDSLLYHSLSRASSLGDDTRFENHHDQVNSRVKAIRDSLQDRSTFRMPNMPSLPSMPRVSSFGFSMNFLNTSNTSVRSKTVTDIVSDILPLPTPKKKSSISPSRASPRASSPEALGEPAAIRDADRTGFLESAMEELTGDIIIMGGYRGSILRSAKPPHRQLWVPVKVGLNIRKVNLEVGLEPEDEERMEENIFASGMLQNIGPVDISRRLFKRLRDCPNARDGKLRVWDYGYDWRLSPHLLSRKLEAFLETLPSNQPNVDGSVKGALVIAHSLGGLITRHVVNKRPELFSGVVYAGVPQSCVNILGPLRNGDAVLLSSRVLTAQVNFTLRTSFVLLPEDGSCFVDIRTKEKYPVDFFSVDDWIKYRFSPCIDPALPPILPSSGSLSNLLSGSLLSLPLPGKKSGTSSPVTPSYSQFDRENRDSPQEHTKTTRAAELLRSSEGGSTDRTIAPQMGNSVHRNPLSNNSTPISTAVTLPREKALVYLRRTLAETKQFKQELHFRPSISDSNLYPPLAVIYGKSIPTCNGAKVYGKEAIPCSDVYDNLSFASGDGVCLAKEAMLPDGYKAAKGGRIRSDRGHVTLLGDLNAVGRALEAVIKGRAKGIGLGLGRREGEVGGVR